MLFDMDGTLVDSEKLWLVASGELTATIGGVLSAGARTAIIGAAMICRRWKASTTGGVW